MRTICSAIASDISAVVPTGRDLTEPPNDKLRLTVHEVRLEAGDRVAHGAVPRNGKA